MSAPNPNLYRRLTASVPLLVTVIVHVVLIGIAGYFVTEQIIGNKKKFEAPPPTETTAAQKQVEHRLQVARKGGGSASASPVSATRIFSTSESALALPEMPELPSTGASSLAGVGFGAGMGVTGTGSGYNTGVGSGSGLGSGFMSLSFLGQTTNNVSKIVFVVDIGRDLMDIKKGGFEAFAIIRTEIMKLINLLPPSAQFNVVLYERYRWNNNTVVAFDSKLVPATAANKQTFFQWFSPINTDKELKAIGINAAKGRQVKWTPRDLTSAGLEEDFVPPEWARALHFSMEMEPDTVYIISGSQGGSTREPTATDIARRKKDNADLLAEMKKEGLTVESVTAARRKSVAKAQSDLDSINAKRVAANKPPYVVREGRRIFDADFQAELKKSGHAMKLETEGWSFKSGKLIWETGVNTSSTTAPFSDLLMHLSKLKRVLIKNNLAVNYFLFVGPNEDTKSAVENLSDFTRRNSGKFELLTTKRLQELTANNNAKK